MKIAILSYGHLDPILPLFKRLRKRVNVKLIMIFSQDAKYESLLTFNDLQVKDGFVNNEIKNNILSRIGMEGYINDIEIFILHNNRVRSIINTLLYFKLKYKLKHYDLIHFNGQHATLIPLLFLLPKKTKKVFVVHDFQPHIGEGGKYNLFSTNWNYRMILKTTRWPLILQNMKDFKFVKYKFPNFNYKLYYIPFGVFENYNYWYSTEHNNIKYDLLFFGRISEYKGLKYLIDAVINLQSKNIYPHLCIAGKGCLHSYKESIDKIKHITLFNYYLNSNKLVRIIQQSKLVVCPYIDASQSGVAMTAFALNKPVIASNVGSFYELLSDEKKGLLVEPGNSDKLSQKLEFILNKEETRKSMIENIKYFKTKGKFNWNNITDEYLNLYKKLK